MDFVDVVPFTSVWRSFSWPACLSLCPVVQVRWCAVSMSLKCSLFLALIALYSTEVCHGRSDFPKHFIYGTCHYVTLGMCCHMVVQSMWTSFELLSINACMKMLAKSQSAFENATTVYGFLLHIKGLIKESIAIITTDWKHFST